jgi:hypothetical protein
LVGGRSLNAAHSFDHRKTRPIPNHSVWAWSFAWTSSAPELISKIPRCGKIYLSVPGDIEDAELSLPDTACSAHQSTIIWIEGHIEEY